MKHKKAERTSFYTAEKGGIQLLLKLVRYFYWIGFNK